MKKVIIATGVLVLIILMGPKPLNPVLDYRLPRVENLPDPEQDPEKKFVKPDNQSIIHWADSSGKKTKFVILYLHGFSASPLEGDPVMQKTASNFGMNLYVPRLFAHGLNKKEPMLEFEVSPLWESAKKALAEAFLMGDSVIIMSTSTGGTLSLMLAASFPQVHSLILYSPNIDLYDSRSFLLTMPWGLQLARLVEKGKYHEFDGPAGKEKYWNTKYRLEALIALKNLLEYGMRPSTFAKIHQPVLMLYYYKDKDNQDNVVSVPAMLNMFDELATPVSLKHKVALPNAQTHAIASNIWSHDIAGVERETNHFLIHALGINPIPASSK